MRCEIDMALINNTLFGRHVQLHVNVAGSACVFHSISSLVLLIKFAILADIFGGLIWLESPLELFENSAKLLKRVQE